MPAYFYLGVILTREKTYNAFIPIFDVVDSGRRMQKEVWRRRPIEGEGSILFDQAICAGRMEYIFGRAIFDS